MYAHFVDTLNLRGIEIARVRPTKVCEWTSGMTPSVELLFEPVRDGELESGTTHIRFGEHGHFKPRITLRCEDSISISLWLHEIGHVCCGSERPRANQISRVERHAWELVGDFYEGKPPDIESHVEVAAWAAAIILTKPLGVDHRIILCALLLSAAASHRRDLGMFLDSIQRCESETGGFSRFMSARGGLLPPKNELDLFTWVCDGAFDLIEQIMPWHPGVRPAAVAKKGKKRPRRKAAP